MKVVRSSKNYVKLAKTAFEMGVKNFFNEIQLAGGLTKPLKYILTCLLPVTLDLELAFSWPWALPWAPPLKFILILTVYS